MHAPNDGDEVMSGINVTPLVDVTMVLLVVFMVTAKLVASTALPVDLPKAATGGAVQTVLAVSIDARGALSVDGAALGGEGELGARARAAASRDRELRAVVHADAAVAHGRVVRVMDVLRTSGVSRLAFAVEPSVGPARAGARP
jgi:biopolymer transport protein ExbD